MLASVSAEVRVDYRFLDHSGLKGVVTNYFSVSNQNSRVNI